ncbi:MAG: tetratricopeptide repeat protein [Verrucomicrobiota bacterium]
MLALGEYEKALKQAEGLYRIHPFSPELNLAVIEALHANGRTEQAQAILHRTIEIEPFGPTPGNSNSSVAFGQLLLQTGLDAKFVLERYFQPAKKADPKGRSAYLAIGQLALSTHDRELAAENFRAGLKLHPNDPEFLLGLEQSQLPLPRNLQKPDLNIQTYLDLALEQNPRFATALLLKAEQLIAKRDFNSARETLKQILQTNPVHSTAWAQLAALALLEEDPSSAQEALKKARQFWPDNPTVSATVGKTLASQYRFAEAIPFLQKASQEDPSSANILFELGSNQLRFGQSDDGWRNVELAHNLDPYNVAAFNLIQLRDKIRDYPILEKDGVRLRMSPEDMAVFGKRALDLAAKSKKTLTEKYQISLSQPVLVEMLPKQEDFAIRTFGLPGGEAFLGVCFGPVITMTSPRGKLGRANWETVLWHEMAHTITLDATRHRIPRWLTEGISVYEERQAKPGWGFGMNAEFRERFLAEEMPAILDIDQSFAGPDIIFGYYHASLVVEFLIENFGLQTMRNILSDLSDGKPLKAILPNRTQPLNQLEKNFRTYAKSQAKGYGPELDWSLLSDEEYQTYRNNPTTWVAQHPKRYSSSMMLASQLIKKQEWNSAQKLLENIIQSAPNNREDNNPYWALSLVYRNSNNTKSERETLIKLVEIDAHHSDAASRLLELSQTLSPAERIKTAQRMLEINPFQETAYRTLFKAAKETQSIQQAQEACTSLLALKPRDSSRLHYELATILLEPNPEQSRREVLKALEQNPRFEIALEFLVNLPPS